MSNFFPCDIHNQGIKFKSAEHCYQFEKAIHHHMEGTAEKVKHAKTALDAKRLGEEVREDTNGSRRKIDMMREILTHKRKQCA